MAMYRGKHAYVTTHEFKSNIAQWTELLRDNTLSIIFVTRYETPVAYYTSLALHDLEDKARQYPLTRKGPAPKSLKKNKS